MKTPCLFRLTPLHTAVACSLTMLLLSAFRPPPLDRLSRDWLDLRCRLCGRAATAPPGPLLELPLVTLGLSALPALAVACLPRLRDGLVLGTAAALALVLADLCLLRVAGAALDTAFPLAGFAASWVTGLLWLAASRARGAASRARGLEAIGDDAFAPPDSLRCIPEMLGMLVAFLGGRRGLVLLNPAPAGASPPERWEILAARGFSPSLQRRITSPRHQGAIDTAAAGNRPMLVRRAAWRHGCLPPERGPGAYRPDFLLWLPLVAGENAIGIAYVDGEGRGGARAARNLPMLASFATRAAAAIEIARTESGTVRPRARPLHEVHFGTIVSAAGAMHDLFRLIEKAAAESSAVLIEGETGTGKELIARAIHYHGPRRERVFIAQNCAALPEPLLESELFGHVRGAFTGASRTTRGFLAIADGGTVFLDEIADCAPAVQAKLLRFLQDGVVRPVGGTRELALDVRIISATNRHLEDEVAKGNFRKDLLYRLNVIPIRVPPLRERQGDIPCLASFFLSQYAERSGKHIEGFTREAMEMLAAYEFPGNVRELENEVARIVALHQGDASVTERDLSDKIRRAAGGGRVPPRAPGAPLRASLRVLEREIISHALREHGGNISRAAAALGLSRFGLYKKLHDHGIPLPPARETGRRP